MIPGTANCTQLDPAVSAAAPLACFPCAGAGVSVAAVCRSGGMRSAVKNSFGFGGTNCSVVYAAP